MADVRLQIAVAASAANAPIECRHEKERETTVFTRKLGRYHARRGGRARPGRPLPTPCPSFPISRAYSTPSAPRVLGRPLERLRIGNPFIVRTIRPEPGDLAGHRWCIQPRPDRQADCLRVRVPISSRSSTSCDRRAVPLARSRSRLFPGRSAWRPSTSQRNAAPYRSRAPGVRPPSTLV